MSNDSSDSTRAQHPGGLRHGLGFHPEDCAEASLARGDRVHRSDIDARFGERAERPGHRSDAVVALEEEAGLSLGDFELELSRRPEELCSVVRDEIELALAAAGKAGEREQVHAL